MIGSSSSWNSGDGPSCPHFLGNLRDWVGACTCRGMTSWPHPCEEVGDEATGAVHRCGLGDCGTDAKAPVPAGGLRQLDSDTLGRSSNPYNGEK